MLHPRGSPGRLRGYVDPGKARDMVVSTEIHWCHFQSSVCAETEFCLTRGLFSLQDRNPPLCSPFAICRRLSDSQRRVSVSEQAQELDDFSSVRELSSYVEMKSGSSGVGAAKGLVNAPFGGLEPSATMSPAASHRPGP